MTRGGDGLVARGAARRLIDQFAQQATGPSGEPPDYARLTEWEREICPIPRSPSGYMSRTATVKTQGANLRAKVGLRDRIHAVGYAYEHGIIRPGG